MNRFQQILEAYYFGQITRLEYLTLLRREFALRLYDMKERNDR